MGQKYTQTDLAKEVGLSQGYIGGTESGRTYPTYVTLVKLAEALGSNLSYFDR